MSPRLAIFLSGRGSTAQALLEVPQINITFVVSNRASANGLLKAKRFGIPTFHFSKDATWMQLNTELKNRSINQIFMCGFMKIIPKEFIDLWQGRIWNIHPSLLPLYAGAHGVEDSLEAGGPYGITIHRATEKMDEGPIWQQRRIDSFDKLPEVRTQNESLDFLRAQVARTEQDMLRVWGWREGGRGHYE